MEPATRSLGPDGPCRSYTLSRGLFLRALGVVYAIAFVSLWVQVDGLIGSDGILPVAEYLGWIGERLGGDAYLDLPTLLWIADGDAALHALCGGGVLLSLALILGLAPLPVLVSLWACYLSLAVGGQTFLGFQWDALLLETGFCALFVAPASWRLRPDDAEPNRGALWLLWFLVFKLMFLSGAVKPLSMDETWLNLSALDYHYWTQPLPTWTAWYVDRLPGSLQRASVLLTYGIEIVLPFLIFAGYRGRRAAAAGTALLMLLISWTGNYGFFNVLTLVLCVPLLDDGCFGRAARGPREQPRRNPWRAARAVPALALIAVSALTLVSELVRTVPPGDEGFAGRAARSVRGVLLDRVEPWVLQPIAPFRTINGYGLFRSMTTARPELVLEGSRDGIEWTPYEFKWKPGDPARRPRFVAPHMPRLDWQMWFAALDPRRAQHWLGGLMAAVLRGSPDVLALFDGNPFPDAPPRYVRLVYYDYRFAAPAQRREGLWWAREPKGPVTPALTAADLGQSTE